jgi:hypothetical protein
VEIEEWDLTSDPTFVSVLDMCRRNKLTFDFELSAKFSRGQIEASRALVSLPHPSCPEQHTYYLNCLLKAMNPPPEIAELIGKHSSDLVALHFGIELNTQQTTYKLYSERRQSQYLFPKKPLAFVGIKWQSSAGCLSNITEYRVQTVQPISYAVITWAEMVNSVLSSSETGGKRIIDWTPISLLGSLVNDLLDAAESGSAESMILHVTDDNTARESLDINLYDAEITVAAISNWLRQLQVYMGIPMTALLEWLRYFSFYQLGHIAAGRDRRKGVFFTLYYGGRTVVPE